MSLAALSAAILAAALPLLADQDAQDCPPGTERVATNQLYEPFHCVPKMDRGGGSPFIQMTPTFKLRHCPRGFHAVATPGQEKRFRCLADPPRESAEPEASPVLAPRSAPRKSETRLEPSAPAETAPPAPKDFVRYTVRGNIQLDFPRDWHVTNAWEDEVPTLYAEYDTGRQGKQLTLIISKIAKNQEGYVDLETAFERDKEFQNAADGGQGTVGGYPARFASVAKESRTAYVDVSPDYYFTLSYSAPADLFEKFEPAYRRMLDSFRAARPKRKEIQ